MYKYKLVHVYIIICIQTFNVRIHLVLKYFIIAKLAHTGIYI